MIKVVIASVCWKGNVKVMATVWKDNDIDWSESSRADADPGMSFEA